MRLHRALRSDWSDVAPQQRTTLQRWAAGSRGIITPGNLVSLIGAVLVVRGLYALAHDQLISGTATVLIGRLADVFDGMAADYTKTKSPLGEGIDATVDKILLAAALYVLIDYNLLPLVVGLVIAIHAVYVMAVSMVARSWKANLHPSRAGKLATVFVWACSGFYLLGDIISGQQHSPDLANTVALICFGAFIVAAVLSSLNYTRATYYKRTMHDGH